MEKQKKIIALAVAAAALSAGGFALQKWQHQQTQKKAEELAETNKKAAVATAENTIRNMLKDPESANFRATKLFENGNACGEVNAKNSYGGYIGYAEWTIIEGKPRIYKEDDKLRLPACEYAQNPDENIKDLCLAYKDLLALYQRYSIDQQKTLREEMKAKNCQRFQR